MTRISAIRIAILLFMFHIAATAPAAEAAPEGRVCESEPVDEVMAYGDVITCSLDVAGDTDVFRFNATGNEIVSVRSSVGSSTCVYLYEPGTAAAINAGCGTNARLIQRLTKAGTHSIVVAGATGQYAIALDRIYPTPSPNSLLLAYGRTIAEVLDPPGDVDLFHSAASATDNISLRGSVQSSTCVYVTGPDGAAITAGCGINARFGFQVSQSGTHVVRVTGQSGPYSLSLQCLSGPCLPPPPPPPPAGLDHYKCYNATPKARTPSFVPVNVTLADDFESRTTRVVRPVSFCNPVDKNGEGISNSDEILVCYTITSAPASTSHTVAVDDELGPPLTLVTSQASMLCVPSKRIP